MSVSAAHTTLDLFTPLDSGYTMISVSCERINYKKQLPIK